jgi:hypothetical protein
VCLCVLAGVGERASRSVEGTGLLKITARDKQSKLRAQEVLVTLFYYVLPMTQHVHLLGTCKKQSREFCNVTETMKER